MSNRDEIRRRGRVPGRVRVADPAPAASPAARALLETLEGRRLLSGVAGVTEGVRLIGITGNQQNASYEDETLYQINLLPRSAGQAAAIDGWADAPGGDNAVATLSAVNHVGVTNGTGALQVAVAQGDPNTGTPAPFWGVMSPNVVDQLRAGATLLTYDMTLIGRELNGGYFGGGTDTSFNGWAQSNELTVAINSPNGWIQRNFAAGGATDSLGLSGQWSGVDGPRSISWDLTQFRSSTGQSLQEFITANNSTDARFWLVTQGADTNGNVGPMRFFFDNFQVTTTTGVVGIGDFEFEPISKIITLPFVPDTDAIGFNPEDGLLYRTSGASSYRDNPQRIGYQDNHYLQTVDVNSPALTQNVIFNATPQGELNNGVPTGPYGYQETPTPPRPSFVLPATTRTPEQTDPSYGDMTGPGEYHAARDLTWSDQHDAFFVADEDGIFRLTPAGNSTFVGRPAMSQPKGIAFYTVDGQRRLLVSERDGTNLYMINPENAEIVGDPILLSDPLGNPVPGILSLVEHPDGDRLYGIAKNSEFPDDPFARQLVEIHLETVEGSTTGTVTVVGNLGVHMADLAFVWPAGGPRVTGIHVSGSQWNDAFKAELAEEGLGDARGFRVDGAAGDDELPWSNINQVSVTFDQDATVTRNDLSVTGVTEPVYNVIDFSYNPTTRVATWTLDKPLANYPTDRRTSDDVTIRLSTAVADGEAAVDVVPGDASRNGATTAQDYSQVRASFGRSSTDEGTDPTRAYSVYRDINANGAITTQDLGIIRGNLGGAAVNPAALASLSASALPPASATKDLFGENGIGVL